MKKTILGLAFALTTNMTFTQDAGSRSFVYSVLATGVQVPVSIASFGYNTSVTALSYIPGSTFVGNNKLLLTTVAATGFGASELYNWKKGKELRTVKAYNWLASTKAGIKTASYWATVKSWFAKKAAVVGEELVALKADVAKSVFSNKQFTDLVARVDAAELENQSLRRALAGYVKPTDLLGYAKSTDVDQLKKDTDLTGYAKTTVVDQLKKDLSALDNDTDVDFKAITERLGANDKAIAELQQKLGVVPVTTPTTVVVQGAPQDTTAPDVKNN